MNANTKDWQDSITRSDWRAHDKAAIRKAQSDYFTSATPETRAALMAETVRRVTETKAPKLSPAQHRYLAWLQTSQGTCDGGACEATKKACRLAGYVGSDGRLTQLGRYRIS